MDRREFLSLSRKKPKSISSYKIGRTFTGITPYNGIWGKAQVVHLLKRATFGAAPQDVTRFSAMSLEDALDILIQENTQVPLPPVNNYQVDGYVDPTGIAPGATWVQAPFLDDDDLNNARRASYKAWWTGQMVHQESCIHEKMVLFWHNHFATETQTIGDARYMYKYNETLRKYALGNFKTLTKEVTLDPGMLVYLNGYLNEKSAADENYSRELLELFTCGKGPDSLYTEPDVRAGARVLTGYRFDPETLETYFDPTKHDTTNKTFSSWFGSQVITGKTGPAGTQELDELLTIIFRQPEVAKFICRKLYQFFIYYEIDEAAEQDVILPLADIFRASNYDIKTVLRALFTSEHFYDPLNMACLIKSPVDFTVGLCREFGVYVAPLSNYEQAYPQLAALQYQASIMQQNIGDPPGVSGWDAYYLAPQFHELWINTDTLPKRNQFTDEMISNLGYNRLGGQLVIDPIHFAKQLEDPANPNRLLADSLTILYRYDVEESVKIMLKYDVLLNGISGADTDKDYYWTNAWNAFIANETNEMNRSIIYNHLRDMYRYIMNLPEYHLA
jgi:uncharacterized protein (DUF1800 family)